MRPRLDAVENGIGHGRGDERRSKRVLMVVLSIAIIVFASGLIGTLFEGAETIPGQAQQAQVEAVEC